MKLENCQLRPGKIVEVIDNKGTIKAVVRGLFSENDDISLLPPIIPFVSNNTSSFSSPKIDDIVWVLTQQGNSQQFFYLGLNKNSIDLQNLQNEDENIEIIFSRKIDEDLTQFYYRDSDGINILNKNDIITMNNGIFIKTNNEHINISLTDKIKHGNGEQPMVLGDDLKTTIDNIISCLENISKACTAPETIGIKAVIEAQLPIIKQTSDKYLSDYSSLD